MTTHDPRRRLGRVGEEMAMRTLQEAGLTILERNWRCRVGEVDIIAQERAPDLVRGGEIHEWLVFVEVRTRRGFTFGAALESITPRKAAKMREVAYHYVRERSWNGPWRIDVVGVQMDEQGRLLSIEHVRHAVHDE
ncbi:MAG: YraN family protein [Caldilinea sp.]|nr:YraN family protein [Caldilinea sp.]MDW8440719.1 YraN family protein [Caldilineaceae bacterium]